MVTLATAGEGRTDCISGKTDEKTWVLMDDTSNTKIGETTLALLWYT